MMCCRCVWTVCSLRFICSAIWRVFRPSLMSRRTSRSRSLSSGCPGKSLHLVEHRRTQFRAQVGVPGQGRPHRVQQLDRGPLFQHIPRGSGLQHAGDVLRVGVHRQGHHLHLRSPDEDLARRFDSAQVGQGNVHNYDVRPAGRGQLHRGAGGPGFAHYLELVVLEQSSQAVAHQFVIVHQHHPGRHRKFSFGSRDAEGTAGTQRVPCSGSDSISKEPPDWLRHSPMLNRQKPKPCRTSSGEGSKPRPR